MGLHRVPVQVSILCTVLLALGVVLAGASHPRIADAQQQGATKWYEDLKNPYEGNPEAVERGRELYVERCSFCHGTLGRGAKGPCLTCGHFYYRGGSNATLFATISGGIPGGQMGAFASSMSADDIWRLIAFLRDQTVKDHPEVEQQRQSQSVPVSARLAKSNYVPPQPSAEADDD